MFVESLKVSQQHYREKIAEIKAGRIELIDANFDTGDPTSPAHYRMAAEAYTGLVDSLEKNNFKFMSSDLRINILTFFMNYRPPFSTVPEQKRWQRTFDELGKLMAVNPPPSADTARNLPAKP
jgi:hypothetical protein